MRRLKNAIVGSIPPRAIRVLLETLEECQDIPAAAGFHVYPRAYYSPLLLNEEIDWTVLDRRRLLPGITLNEQRALELLEKMSGYRAELDEIPYERDGKTPFWFANDWFTISTPPVCTPCCGISSRTGMWNSAAATARSSAHEPWRAISLKALQLRL